MLDKVCAVRRTDQGRGNDQVRHGDVDQLRSGKIGGGVLKPLNWGKNG